MGDSKTMRFTKEYKLAVRLAQEFGAYTAAI